MMKLGGLHSRRQQWLGGASGSYHGTPKSDYKKGHCTRTVHGHLRRSLRGESILVLGLEEVAGLYPSAK